MIHEPERRLLATAARDLGVVHDHLVTLADQVDDSQAWGVQAIASWVGSVADNLKAALAGLDRPKRGPEQDFELTLRANDPDDFEFNPPTTVDPPSRD